MTNEEAIEWLISMYNIANQINDCLEYKETLDIAIKALEKQPCECTEHPCLGKLCEYYKQPCEDCISREEAVNYFEENLIEVFDKHEVADEIHYNLPSVTPQQTGWIPVSERLPEDGAYVLGQSKLGGINIYQKNKEIRPTGICGGWFADDTWYSTNFIIAWMPLPQPYKAESEDEGNAE